MTDSEMKSEMEKMKAEMEKMETVLKYYWSNGMLSNDCGWKSPDSWNEELEKAEAGESVEEEETQKNKMIFNQLIKDYTKWTDNIKMEIDEEYNEDYTSQNDITTLIIEYRDNDVEDIFVKKHDCECCPDEESIEIMEAMLKYNQDKIGKEPMFRKDKNYFIEFMKRHKIGESLSREDKDYFIEYMKN